MEMRIKFPGGKKVTAEFEGYNVTTDQPTEGGGGGTAPGPFDLFLASIGTCAGFFILEFCQKRNIPTTGLELVERVEWNSDETMVAKIKIMVKLPKEFPAKYRDSVVNIANLCTVKKHLQSPPQIEVVTL